MRPNKGASHTAVHIQMASVSLHFMCSSTLRMFGGMQNLHPNWLSSTMLLPVSLRRVHMSLQLAMRHEQHLHADWTMCCGLCLLQRSRCCSC